MKDLKSVIFIHIPRTAGTSILTAMGTYKKEHRHFFARKHIALRPDWNECFKFSFIRNPWDRAVSLFSHQTKGEKDFKSWLMEMVARDGHPNDRTQEWKVSDKMKSTGGTGIPWKCQSDWLVDDNKDICVDFVGRFESLKQDFERVCDIMNLKLQLPHINKTMRKDYTKYYDEETKQIVADWHKTDIQNFGYTFGAPVRIL
jgi:hypothetical protein